MKRLMWAMPAALIWLLMSVTPAQAYGEPWDWCSSVTVNSNGAKNVAALSVSGNCDGGRLRLTGSLQRRSGGFDLRGAMGSTAVILKGQVGTYTAIYGSIDYEDVDIKGSGSKYFCDLDGWIAGEYVSPQDGSLFGRICPILVGLRR